MGPSFWSDLTFPLANAGSGTQGVAALSTVTHLRLTNRQLTATADDEVEAIAGVTVVLELLVLVVPLPQPTSARPSAVAVTVKKRFRTVSAFQPHWLASSRPLV